MKKLIPFLAGLLMASAVFGQFEIIRPGGNHSVNDSLIVINGKASQELTTTTFDVINTGALSIGVKCKRFDTVVVAGTSNYLCWGLCYGPSSATEWTAPSTQSINAGDTNKTFTADYNDSGKAGTEIIRYVFFNSTNSSDSAWVLVKFTVINDLGIAPLTANTLTISAPYPNPAGRYASFNYHTSAMSHLSIYNSIGQQVESMVLNPSGNRVNMDVSGMPSGIYICQMTSQGAQPLYQKLVVAH